MATAPLTLVETAPSEKPKYAFPEVAPVVKVAAWKTADGEYHENIETARETTTKMFLIDFAKTNDLTTPTKMAMAIAECMPMIRARVENALK